MKLAYTVRPALEQDDKSDRLQITSTSLGSISISFRPLPLYNPDNIQQLSGKNDFMDNHGPLPIENLPPFKQRGPIVYVEATPFEASFSTIPSIAKVASPFEVRYMLTNKTTLQQRIKVSMIETDKVLRYSLLVTKIGKTVLPALSVSSLRYNSWIIRSGEEDSIYVLP